jgi:ankyrin repeat protein
VHFAAAEGHLETVRLLLDAGADVHGTGDLHKGDVIGWASRPGNEAVIALLVERGARHHIFSAMALGDLDLVQRLVEEDPDCLSRRRSRFENEHTPLHAAFIPPDGLGWLSGKPDYAMLELLIELGADVEARDDKGRTPLAVAMLRAGCRSATANSRWVREAIPAHATRRCGSSPTASRSSINTSRRGSSGWPSRGQPVDPATNRTSGSTRISMNPSTAGASSVSATSTD